MAIIWFFVNGCTPLAEKFANRKVNIPLGIIKKTENTYVWPQYSWDVESYTRGYCSRKGASFVWVWIVGGFIGNPSIITMGSRVVSVVYTFFFDVV